MSKRFFFENRAVYEIMSKNLVEPKGPQMTIQRRVACWISRATRVEAHAAPAPVHRHPHTNAHALTRARTQTQKYAIRIAF